MSTILGTILSSEGRLSIVWTAAGVPCRAKDINIILTYSSAEDTHDLHGPLYSTVIDVAWRGVVQLKVRNPRPSLKQPSPIIKTELLSPYTTNENQNHSTNLRSPITRINARTRAATSPFVGRFTHFTAHRKPFHSISKAILVHSSQAYLLHLLTHHHKHRIGCFHSGESTNRTTKSPDLEQISQQVPTQTTAKRPATKFL